MRTIKDHYLSIYCRHHDERLTIKLILKSVFKIYLVKQLKLGNIKLKNTGVKVTESLKTARNIKFHFS